MVRSWRLVAAASMIFSQLGVMFMMERDVESGVTSRSLKAHRAPRDTLVNVNDLS